MLKRIKIHFNYNLTIYSSLAYWTTIKCSTTMLLFSYVRKLQFKKDSIDHLKLESNRDYQDERFCVECNDWQWSTENMYVTSKNKTKQPSANTGNKCNTCSIWSIWLMWLLQNQKKNTMSFNTFFKMDQGAPPLIPWFCPSLPTTIASSGRSVWETPLAKCLVGRKQDTNLSGFKTYTETKEIYRYNIFDIYNYITTNSSFKDFDSFVSLPGFHCGQKETNKMLVNPFE